MTFIPEANAQITTSLCAVAAMVFTVSTATAVTAQCDLAQSTVSRHDATSNQDFGAAIFVESDTAIVGAPTDTENGPGAGAAYVYGFDGEAWTEEQKLLASDNGFGDNFGAAVSVHDDVAIIGAPFDDENGMFAGSAYIFRYDASKSQWCEEQKLLDVDGSLLDTFGSAVAITRDFAFVGAPLDSDPADFHSGAVHIYRFDSAKAQWIESQKLIVNGMEIGGGFVGFSIAVDNDTLFVSAHTADFNGSGSGAVYVYGLEGDTWVFRQRLLASDGAPLDVFGISLDLSDAVAVIGASFDDNAGMNSGSAYVFRFDGDSWVEEQRLHAHDGATGDEFGDAVTIARDTIVIGAAKHDDGSEDVGAAYVFKYDGLRWNQTQHLHARNAAPDDHFGAAVAVAGEMALVGAPQNDGAGNNAGATYTFNVDDCRADLANGDCVVDTFDLLALIEAWNTNGPGADLASPNTVVDVFDLFEVLENWGDCP